MNQYTLSRIKERMNKELCDTLKNYYSLRETNYLNGWMKAKYIENQKIN